jgi:hypothetical protein
MIQEIFSEAGLAILTVIGIFIASRFMKPEEDTKL